MFHLRGPAAHSLVPTVLAPAALLLALSGLALAQGNQVEALEGTFDERVVAIEGAADKLQLKLAGRTLALDTVKTIRLGRGRRARAGLAKLLLVNGDYLRGKVESGKGDLVGFKSEALGRLDVNIELIRALMPEVDSPAQERALEAKLAAKSKSDWVILASGGTVRGTIELIDGAKVTINTNTEGGDKMGTLPIDWVKVKMASITPLDDEEAAEPSGLVVAVRLIDGSLLRGAPVSMDEKALVIEHGLAKDGKLRISRQRIEQIAVQNGRFTYLSDLEPAAVKQGFPPEYTFEPEVWSFKRDTNVSGGVLRLDGKAFAKGLGVHSYCKLSYRINKGYKSFRATVGLDDSVKYLGEPGFGGVVFRVLVDGKPAKGFAEGLRIRKGEKSKTITVDVTGKQTLTLVADFDPASLHVLGRANWADAHLIKR